MEISIIVPIYNAEKYLRNCLRAISNQTYKDIEVLLINDGSTDTSESICMEYVLKDSRFQYFKISNHGVSYARNYGIQKAKGDYLCFVDSDDIIDKEFCEVLLTNLIMYKCDLSVCNYVETTKPMPLKKNSVFIDVKYEDKIFWLINKYEGFLCNKMYKKAIIRAYGLKIDEELSMCEDLVFNLAYLKYIKGIVYTNDVLYEYLIHQGNASRSMTDKWFTILSAVSKVNADISHYKNSDLNAVAWFIINSCFEAKTRCRILDKDFSLLLNKYDIDFYEIKRRYKNRILMDKKFNIKNKLKLILFDSFPHIAEKIKMKKIVKGI